MQLEIFDFVGVILSVATALAIAFYRLNKYHHSAHIPRKLDLYDRLKAGLPENSALNNVVSNVTEEEVFYIIFKRSGSEKYRESITSLYLKGLFSIRQLQLAILHIDEDKEGIYGVFGQKQIVCTWVLSVLLFLGLLMITLVLVASFGIATPEVVAIGVGQFIVGSLLLMFIGAETIRLTVARKVCDQVNEMRKKGDLDNPQESNVDIEQNNEALNI